MTSEIKPCTCNAPSFISKSTKWGTRKICNGCGKEYKKSQQQPNQTFPNGDIKTCTCLETRCEHYRSDFVKYCEENPIEQQKEGEKCNRSSYWYSKEDESKNISSNEDSGMEWRETLIKKWYIYDMERATPAGAEKDLISFVEQLLASNTKEEIGKHNARILNEYQLQGLGDERVLFPVLEKATKDYEGK